jgi:hypothetical protein
MKLFELLLLYFSKYLEKIMILCVPHSILSSWQSAESGHFQEFKKFQDSKVKVPFLQAIVRPLTRLLPGPFLGL